MTESAIVSKLDKTLSPSCFDVTPFNKPKAGERLEFEVNLIAESSDGMKKNAVVEPNLPSWGTFSISCDEGLALGGKDTAPPPLGYLASGIAFCLLTHLTEYVKTNKLDVTNIRIEQRMKFSTSVLTNAVPAGSMVGACDGLETYILVESPEPEEKIQKLIATSEAACLALQSIVNQTPQNTKVLFNGNDLQVA